MFHDRLDRRRDEQSVEKTVSALPDILSTFRYNLLELQYTIGWNGTDN